MSLGKNYLSYDTIEGLPLQQLRNSTYLNSHQLKSAKTHINWQLAYNICSDSITSEFNLQLVMKQGGLEGGQKSASFMDSHSHFHLAQNWTIWLDFWIDMQALEFFIILLSLIFSPLCDCWAFAILKNIPGFARCPASSLLGVGAGRAHASNTAPGMYAWGAKLCDVKLGCCQIT